MGVLPTLINCAVVAYFLYTVFEWRCFLEFMVSAAFVWDWRRGGDCLTRYAFG